MEGPKHMRMCVGLWNNSTHGQSVRNYDYLWPLLMGLSSCSTTLSLVWCSSQSESLAHWFPWPPSLNLPGRCYFRDPALILFAPLCIFRFGWISTAGFVHNPYVNLYINACIWPGFVDGVLYCCVFLYGTDCRALDFISFLRFTFLSVLLFDAQEWTFVASCFGTFGMRKAINGSYCDSWITWLGTFPFHSFSITECPIALQLIPM